MSEEAPADERPRAWAPRLGAWMARVAVLGTVLATLGLPILGARWLFVLLAAGAAVATGRPSLAGRRWAAAIAVAATVLAFRALRPEARIEEAHHAFVTLGPGEPLEQGLPPDVHAALRSELEAAYPAEHRCDVARPGCWVKYGVPSTWYAFSADGFWTRPRWSRALRTIDFEDRVSFRAGFANQRPFNWYDGVSDIPRRRMPFYVLYEWPASVVGSELCFRGTVLWEAADGRFVREPGAATERRCRVVTAADVGRRTVGLGVRPRPDLSMHLTPSLGLVVRHGMHDTLRLVGAIAIVALTIGIDVRRLAWVGLLGAAAAVHVAGLAPRLYDGFEAMAGGTDGRTYHAFSYEIVRGLARGELGAVLDGGEAGRPFYFQPGMRYVRAAEKILFGDSNLGMVALLAAWPLALAAWLRGFVGTRAAVAGALVFVTAGLGERSGLAFAPIVGDANLGLAEPFAYLAFVAGLAAASRRGPPRAADAAAGAALLAAAAVVRPNVVVGAGLFLAVRGATWLRAREWRAAAALALGFMPVLLPLARNLWVAGEPVLFSASGGHPRNFTMPPGDWLVAARQMLAGEVGTTERAAALRQLTTWAGGWRYAAFGALAAVTTLGWRRIDPRLLAVGVAALGQHAVLWVFRADGRFQRLAWLLTTVVLGLVALDAWRARRERTALARAAGLAA